MTELNEYLAAWEPVSPSLQGVAEALGINLDDPVEQAALALHRRVRELENTVTRVRKLHQREVIAVHEGYGEEAWCPVCHQHWPCLTIRILDEGDDQ